MKRMKVALFVGLAAVAVQAHKIAVSWVSNGVLQATGLEPGASCTLAWSSDLQSGFITNNSPFAGLTADSNGIVQVTIPMFFQIITPDIPAGMVVIPAGTNSGTDPDFGAYSFTVTNEFYMDAKEVTKGKWDTVYGWAISNGYMFDNTGLGKAEDHPIHTVNWYDSVKWCNARSEMEGRVPCYTVNSNTYKSGQSNPDCNVEANGFRLPTNEEWEYAARGALNSKRFPWGDTIDHSDANYRANGSAYTYDISPYSNYTYHPDYDDGGTPHTSPVGSFNANGYGLYDMAGNASEWCTSASGENPAVRGGSSDLITVWARTGFAPMAFPTFTNYDLGFRSICR